LLLHGGRPRHRPDDLDLLGAVVPLELLFVVVVVLVLFMLVLLVLVLVQGGTLCLEV